MANLIDAAGNTTTQSAKAVGGDYLAANKQQVAIPGRQGPFASFLFPGMGDEARFDAHPVRTSTGDIENQLGVYEVNPKATVRRYSGPLTDDMRGTGANQTLEGFTQRLDALAVALQGKLHEKAVQTWSKFWINVIKSETFAPFSGWERKVEIFRGGLLSQTGLSKWRRILPVPEAGFNHPSNLPGFQTFQTTSEELTGIGYETGWGSDDINIDHLRNTPGAAKIVKDILEFGIGEGLNIKEIYNRETYIQLSCSAHKAFVMCSDCQCVEDVTGNRVYCYDPHIAPDAYHPSANGTDSFGNSYTTSDWVATVDDRSAINNGEKVCKLDAQMRDAYGQFHAVASYVTDPKTGEAMPFLIADAGPANSHLPIERPNFLMLERLNNILAQNCPEQASSRDGGSPVFPITFKPDDIDKLIRANPADWRAYLEANPKGLLTYYGLSEGKEFKRWSITDDTNQMRFKILRYIPEYTSQVAASYGNIGFRPGDDTSIQGRAAYVCIAVNPKMLSPKRVGKNGVHVAVPNPEYFTAPLAIANVFLRDTFVNMLEGAPGAIGSGTNFGPFPAFNGQWGFLNIQDRQGNPFKTHGNFYGLFRNHIRPTKYTQEACSFLYARDMQVFEAFTQAQNKILNPDYTGADQTVAVNGVDGLDYFAGLTSSGAATTLPAGTAFAVELSPTPHVALGVGKKAVVKLTDKVTGQADAVTRTDCVVLDDTMWPRVIVAPIAQATLANMGLKDTVTSATVDSTTVYTHTLGFLTAAGHTYVTEVVAK